MNLGPHGHFIIASYSIVGFVLAAVIAWLLYDGNRLSKVLRNLDQRANPKS